METTENVDSNVHRSPLAALEDAQAAYIRKLEDRLDALENRMLNIEEAGPGNDIAINENESSMDSESDDSISSDGSYVNKKEGVEANHPPFPPTVAEVRGVDFVQATHHVFMASSIPAIEFAKFPEKESEEDTKLATFKNAFKDFSPKEALEMINSNYMKPHDVDLRLLFDHINILSMPLSQILWSIYYDKTLPPNQIARFKEQERALDSKAEPSGEIYKNSMLLDELRAYVRLMEDTVMEYYATFKTKTAADNLKIYYVDIWHLFEPGEIIYYSEAKDAPSKMDYSKLERSKRPDQKLWRVYSRLRSDDGWCVKAYCIDYDGESYVCVKEWFMIESFEGRKSVNSLRVYPVRFATNAKRLMEDATEAGRGFIKNLDSKLLGHEGWTWVSDQSSGTSLIYVSGDVVIDFAEAFRVHPDWKPIPMAPAIYYGGGWGTDNDDDDRTRWYWTDGHELKCNSGKGEWNGRQIRNAFLIASALAHSEKTNGVPKGANKCDLRAKHFRTVAEAQSGFERYLFETTGTTDEKAAHDQGTRADHVVSADGRVAPQTPVPTPAQPVQPPIHPAVMASQYPSHQPLTPTRNPTTYNLSHSPNNVYLQQPHPHPHPQPQPQPQHYVYGQAPQDTFGQPSATTGHPVQWALTPGSSQPQRPRPQPHVADSDSDT
ncbi:hypothetical protein N7533_005227 [Penicillium manginii]|uniref:uncharacterized protein n=1 Tax=Penicillium manginii TaxID=203109 RepID=UPI00254828C5|nr:uncharacterized protein N7533_005227 [Penicillium manginii]KAJ5755684.1 hypothetical protein N7533_005227 [Penicillium manginii]